MIIGLISCGPEQMVEDVLLKRRKYSKTNVSFKDHADLFSYWWILYYIYL